MGKEPREEAGTSLSKSSKTTSDGLLLIAVRKNSLISWRRRPTDRPKRCALYAFSQKLPAPAKETHGIQTTCTPPPERTFS